MNWETSDAEENIKTIKNEVNIVDAGIEWSPATLENFIDFPRNLHFLKVFKKVFPNRNKQQGGSFYEKEEHHKRGENKVHDTKSSNHIHGPIILQVKAQTRSLQSWVRHSRLTYKVAWVGYKYKSVNYDVCIKSAIFPE